MKLSIVKILSLFALLFLLTPAALAQPDPSQSSVQECLVTCPLGDIDFLVVVRDASGNPISGSIVEISFCACAGQQLCNAGGSCPDGTLDRLLATTDAAGEALFAMAAGGACPGAQAEISADGVFLAQRDVKAMDVDNNFIVEQASDFPDFSSLANDYNCDGLVNLPDFTEFGLHGNLGHSCEGPVSAEDHSWGAVKSRWP